MVNVRERRNHIWYKHVSNIMQIRALTSHHVSNFKVVLTKSNTSSWTCCVTYDFTRHMWSGPSCTSNILLVYSFRTYLEWEKNLLSHCLKDQESWGKGEHLSMKGCSCWNRYIEELCSSAFSIAIIRYILYKNKKNF